MDYIRNLTLEPYKGIKQDDTKYIPTGFTSDYLTDDLMSRKLTFVTGQSEEGKSIIAHRMALAAVGSGFKVLIVDGEYYQEELIRELYLKLIGNDPTYYELVKPNKISKKEPTPYALNLLSKWHKDKIYIISKNECDFADYEQLFNTIVAAVKLYSIDEIILDNMMSLVESTQAERNAKQADFVKNIIRIDRNFNCTGIIVNHPKKQLERGSELDIFDMSGTADMPSLADNVYIVQRNFEKETEYEPDGWLYLKKNKLNGKHKKMPLKFDDDSRTYLEIEELCGENIIVSLDIDWKMKNTKRS